MYNLLLAHSAVIWHMKLWYAVPAILAISLVYAATRHERLGPIFAHAARVAVWLVGFMLLVLVVLALVSWFM